MCVTSAKSGRRGCSNSGGRAYNVSVRRMKKQTIVLMVLLTAAVLIAACACTKIIEENSVPAPQASAGASGKAEIEAQPFLICLDGLSAKEAENSANGSDPALQVGAGEWKTLPVCDLSSGGTDLHPDEKAAPCSINVCQKISAEAAGVGSCAVRARGKACVLKQ